MNVRRTLAIGFFGAALGGSAAACGLLDSTFCDIPVFCTSLPGELEMEDCSDFWRFSDGEAEFSDIEVASDKCLCRSWQCNDGRTADLCTPTSGGSTVLWSLGDGDLATFSDGTTKSFREGAAICLGYASCDFQVISCSEGRWYFDCQDGEGDTVDYIAWDGTVIESEDSIRRYCDGESLDTAQFSCKPLVVCEDYVSEGSCESLDCFWFSSTLECSGTESCYHDNETACNADSACVWN